MLRVAFPFQFEGYESKIGCTRCGAAHFVLHFCTIAESNDKTLTLTFSSRVVGWKLCLSLRVGFSGVLCLFLGPRHAVKSDGALKYALLNKI